MKKSPWNMDDKTAKAAARMGFNEFQLSVIAMGLESIIPRYKKAANRYRKIGDESGAKVCDITALRTKEIMEQINMELHGFRSLKDYRRRHFPKRRKGD